MCRRSSTSPSSAVRAPGPARSSACSQIASKRVFSRAPSGPPDSLQNRVLRKPMPSSITATIGCPARAA